MSVAAAPAVVETDGAVDRAPDWVATGTPEPLRSRLDELEGARFEDCVSSNRTCEIALHRETGREYRSIVLTLEELTR